MWHVRICLCMRTHPLMNIHQVSSHMSWFYIFYDESFEQRLFWWKTCVVLCVSGALHHHARLAIHHRYSNYDVCDIFLFFLHSTLIKYFIGIGIYAVQKILQNDKGEHISMPIFAIFMCVWSTFMTEIWKGLQARYAMEWLVAFSLWYIVLASYT